MKTYIRTLLVACSVFNFGSLAARAQLLDHLRALTVARLPVGDPSVTVTNIAGQPTDGPKDIAVADLDGDGHSDFAVSDKDGSITVYFGQGDGTFVSPLFLRTWTNAPLDTAGYAITNYVTNCTAVWTNSWDSNGIHQTNW